MWIRKSIITVDILYFLPDYSNILQEFVWQTEDTIPNIPKVNKFLLYWHENIEAIINEIRIIDSYNNKWQKIDWIIKNG